MLPYLCFLCLRCTAQYPFKLPSPLFSPVLSAAKRKWSKTGGLKFRFLGLDILQALGQKALLPSWDFVFLGIFFLIFLVERFWRGGGSHEPFRQSA